MEQATGWGLGHSKVCQNRKDLTSGKKKDLSNAELHEHWLFLQLKGL